MSVTVEEPQRAPEGDIPITKETSEKGPGNVDNNAEPMQNGQNDKSGSGAPRIIMAYIPASPSPSYSTPAPGRNTPEASNDGGRPVIPNLTVKLNQAIHEYRAREERVGDLGQPDDEGYEGDTYFPDEHQGCCDHDHYENQHAAHDEQCSPLHFQNGCGGHSTSVNVPECWTPYHSASSAPLYMQPPFGPLFQQQQQQQQGQQYSIPYYPPVSQPYSFLFPFSHYYFPNPHQFPYHHQHFSTALAPSTHLFAPPARPPHFHPIPPQHQPHPFPPHHFQHPQAQDPTVIDLTQRLQNVQAQLNGLDAAHEVEIWRHGKYNFHRRRAKQLRKIKRDRVEEMVTVVRELRALGVSGGHGRHHPLYVQPQGQQEMQGMWSTAPGWGYGAEFEQGWGYGQEAGYWPGLYGHQQEQWLEGGSGHGHGLGQVGSWSEVEVEYEGGHGGCGCAEDGAHVDSPRDSAFESMAYECGCTTIDGEADLVDESIDVVTPGGTRARALSLDGMREQVDAVEAHEKKRGDASENEQGESVENNSSCARAGFWSDAQAGISEELRGNWRKKMSE